MTKPVLYDVLIVGGGLVGLVLAAACAQEKSLSIGVIQEGCVEDAGAGYFPSLYDVRVSAIHLGGVEILNRLGVWDRIVQRRVSPYTCMVVWDLKSPACIQFDASEIHEFCLGYILEHRVMHEALREALECAGVQVYEPVRPIRIQEGPEVVAVYLETGEVVHTKLLVGADGKSSWVGRVSGLSEAGGATEWRGEQAWVGVVQTELPHEQTAWQRFLETGPLAVLPLAHPHHGSFVWSMGEEEARVYQAMPEEEFNRALSRAFAYRLGRLSVVGQRVNFPLMRHHVRRYVKPRIALVGDAAHTILPLAGQGFNLGIMDAMCLGEVIQAAHRDQQDIGAYPVLRRYERRRRPQNAIMHWSMEGIHRLFLAKSSPLRSMRYWGVQGVNAVPLLKQFFMRRAQGS